MSRVIESIPALAGKVLTWIVVVLMLCNGLLTSAAMLRYNARANRPEADNHFEELLDQQYDNTFIERRWPNMIVTDKPF